MITVPRLFMRHWRRALAAVALAIVAAVALAYVVLRMSLATVDGNISVTGLAAPVTIERDANGVPTITGTSRADVSFALGYVHAQERFFQMDLSRRAAAGELAELFGEVALAVDKRARLHGLRAVARAVIEREPPRRHSQLVAYSDGVNAGLADLGARPFEYWLTGGTPRDWRVEDTVLVLFAMYFDLTDARAVADGQRGAMRAVLPPAVFDWLAADGGRWDAPIAGEAIAAPALPQERWFAGAPVALSRPDDPQFPEEAIGSNSWVVSGALTAHGGAMLANDMHLGLRVPNVWYRARLVETAGNSVSDATGVTLPGVPGIVVGSNGRIAWGFTNSYGDWSDRVELSRAPGAPDRYLVPAGSESFQTRRETIAVKGGDSVAFDVTTSRFGPVIEEGGTATALRWLAHQPAASNLGLLDMLDMRDVDEALALANRSGLPPQNIVVAGRDGRIGWSIAGRIPLRYGYDPRLPVASDANAGWRGWLDPADYPRQVDPPAQRIWTANARVADVAAAARIGRGGYPLGARAGQIRDRLFQSERFDERDMLAIQLDDRGLFLMPWRTLLLETLSPGAVAAHPERAMLRRVLEEGNMRASVDSVAYRAVREFRGRVERTLLSLFLAPVLDVQPDFNFRRLSQREGALWQTVSQRPSHLVPPGHADWDAYLLGEIDGRIRDGGELPLAARTWGQVNTVQVDHPLSRALPGFLARRLNMPRQALPGDAWMPRVQSRGFGASERIVVAPGHEASGLFHMPGGQSGHPLSPFYSSGHEEWARGAATPFLPGPARYTLTLVAETTNP